jgi:transcriptional regulator with XRE-family HTH domain
MNWSCHAYTGLDDMTSQSKRTGTRMRDTRLAAGFTQEQLAHRAGVAVATVSRLENGRTAYPRPDEFERIAAALGTTADALMGIEDESPSASDDQEGLTDEDLDRQIAEHLKDSSTMLAFMGKVRDPKRLSRQVKLAILETLDETAPRNRHQD